VSDTYQIRCPDCTWESDGFEDYRGEAFAQVNAAMHYVQVHGGVIPDDAAFGDEQCPKCEAILGFNDSVSCSECGFIPEGVRA